MVQGSCDFKINESRYIALFVVSGSINEFFQLIMRLFIIIVHDSFLNRFYLVEKCGVTPHCLYRDSLTLGWVLLVVSHHPDKLGDDSYCDK